MWQSGELLSIAAARGCSVPEIRQGCPAGSGEAAQVADDLRSEKLCRLDAVIDSDSPVGVAHEEEAGSGEVLFYLQQALLVADSVLGNALLPSG